MRPLGSYRRFRAGRYVVQTWFGSALTVRIPPGPFFQAHQLPFCETMQYVVAPAVTEFVMTDGMGTGVAVEPLPAASTAAVLTQTPAGNAWS
jgi:hypothetical protein